MVWMSDGVGVIWLRGSATAIATCATVMTNGCEENQPEYLKSALIKFRRSRALTITSRLPIREFLVRAESPTRTTRPAHARACY